MTPKIHLEAQAILSKIINSDSVMEKINLQAKLMELGFSYNPYTNKIHNIFSSNRNS